MQPTRVRYLRILLFSVVNVFIITVLILLILLLVPFGIRYLLADSTNSLEEIRDRLAVAAASDTEEEEVAAASDTEQEEVVVEHPAIDAEEVAAEALLSLRNSLVEPSPVVRRQQPRRRQRSAAPLRNIKPDQD